MTKPAATIIEKQKQIENLRKAAGKAKTQVQDAKREIKMYGEWLQQDPPRTHLSRLIAEAEQDLAQATAAQAQALAALAAAEAALPEVKPSQFAAVLKWFGGAALAKAKDALELVDASLEHGSWVPGASRKVAAALKPNVAKKNIKIGSSYDAPKAEKAIYYAVQYGSFGGVAGLTLQDATQALRGEALEFFIDFKPLVDAMKVLDATKPVPVFTTMNASPTISAELKRQDAAQVEVCPMEFKKVERLNPKTNQVEIHTIVILLWPEGVVHGTSRYTEGCQCHACGHAIRNPFNWVPLVLADSKGSKKSLWVGRDCAETLFGVKMDGDLELADGQR